MDPITEFRAVVGDDAEDTCLFLVTTSGGSPKCIPVAVAALPSLEVALKAAREKTGR